MTVREVLPVDAEKLMHEGWILLDVRTPGEWRAIHAVGSLNLPLNEISEKTLSHICKGQKRILAICQSGGRSKKACEALTRIEGIEVVSVMGGTSAWAENGLPVEKGKGVISIERQVRIIAGLLVLVGTILGLMLSPTILAVPIFVGAGLIFAGLTDFCGMALFLTRMPWNKGENVKCSRS